MRVRGGRVAKKNNWTPDHKNFYALPQSEIEIERTDPGPGYRHVVTVAQLRQFLAILPDWEELAIGLNVISISSGNEEWDGLSEPGAVVITAWTADLWWWVRKAWAEHNAELLALLEVERAPLEKYPQFVELRWTDAQARAYKLLEVLVHELGHHHDRMTTRGDRAPRGEPYADAYARRVRTEVWPVYVHQFGI